MQLDLGPPTNVLSARVPPDSERTASLGLPHILLIIVVLGGHNNTLGDKVSTVEPDTKLANHADVTGTLGERLHEVLGAGARNGSQVVDQV